jgi:hypothetical protein
MIRRLGGFGRFRKLTPRRKEGQAAKETGFVGIDFRTLRQLEIEPLQAGDIGAGTGRQEELNRLTLVTP